MMFIKYNIPFLKKLFLIMVLFVASTGFAQTISVGGSHWNVNPPAITEAGTDYAGTYESASNQITLSGNIPRSFLNLLSSGVAARVTVHYVPNPWDSNLKLYAKRIGGTTTINGICILCTSSIVGGTAYIEIPQGAGVQLFTINFSGPLGLGTNVDYSNVNVQLQISGVSVTVPVDNYSATIVFTIGPP